MAVLLTYDVDSKHVEIKNRLIANYGYVKAMTGSRKSDNKAAQTDLPNTTVFHATKGKTQACEDIVAVANYCGAILEKYLAYESGDSWEGETSRLL